jgi:hypothetical protein
MLRQTASAPVSAIAVAYFAVASFQMAALTPERQPWNSIAVSQEPLRNSPERSRIFGGTGAPAACGFA